MLLFLTHEIDSLMRVIEPVEFADARRRGVVVLPELFLLLVRFVALANEIVPLLEVLKRAHVSSLEEFGESKEDEEVREDGLLALRRAPSHFLLGFVGGLLPSGSHTLPAGRGSVFRIFLLRILDGNGDLVGRENAARVDLDWQHAGRRDFRNHHVDLIHSNELR